MLYMDSLKINTYQFITINCIFLIDFKLSTEKPTKIFLFIHLNQDRLRNNILISLHMYISLFLFKAVILLSVLKIYIK